MLCDILGLSDPPVGSTTPSPPPWAPVHCMAQPEVGLLLSEGL